MKTRKKTRARRPEKKRVSKTALVCLGVFVLGLAAFIGTKLVLQSYSTTLAVQNQSLTNQIDENTAAIDGLKTEISKLQEKSRVLGMLEGQVYDNKNNVYYYGD